VTLEPPGPEQPIRRVGRYALYGGIASGGMARVHFGRLLGPSGFSRTVAIKRLHPQFTESKELVAMLLDEARLVSRIQHPNVVSTIDMVADDGELFVVMEYVPGESLARLIRMTREAGATIPVPVATSIACGFLHGLHAAHIAKSELGEPLDIVHRDVSPHNVLVGTDGLARVLDFGVAKARGRMQSTRAGQVKGKLAYLAPEQILCDEVSPRTDVYAASVVLWETLTCERLFESGNDGAVLNRVLHGEVRPPSAVVPGLSPVLDALVLRGLARDPEQRFASTLELAIALEEGVGSITAHRVAVWVNGIASASLAEREAELARIEQHSLQNAPADHGEGAPRPAQSSRARPARRAGPGATESQVSNLSVVTPAPSATYPTRGPSRASGALAFAGVSLLLAVAAFASWRLGRDSNASPGAVPDPPAPDSTSATAPPAGAPEPTVSPIESAAVVATGRPRTTRAAPPRAAAAPSAVPSAVPTNAPRPDCDPPYVIDAQGVRRWKRECR